MGFPVRILARDLSGSLNKDQRHRLERVMRLRPGDAFVITDGRGHEADATLENNGEYSASEWRTPAREAKLDICLFAAIIKGDRFDWLIEKAVELGVKKIVPFFCQHSVVKKVSENKTKRWQKIAQSAMLQCGGCILPEVTEPRSLKKIAAEKKYFPSIVLYEADTQNSLEDFKQLKTRDACNILTGPEGGFSSEEIQALQNMGWQIVWLGPRIFRAETAPLIAIASVIDCCWGHK